jgi:hypothetical protein
VSRRARHWDDTPARRRTAEEVVVVCTNEGRHSERLVGRLGWTREDIDRADPRWQPAHFVLRGERGDISSPGHRNTVRLHCDTCHRDIQRAETWIAQRTRRLLDAEVRRIELIHLIRLP